MIATFVRIRTSVLIGLLGLLIGLMCRQPARTVVWIVAGVLVLWFYIGNVATQKRYERMLNEVGAGDSVATQAKREDLQLWLLRGQARAFARYAIVGALITAAGIAVSFSYSGATRAAIISASVVSGGWLALLGLTVSARLRAGPIARLAARSHATDAAPRDDDGHLSAGS